MSGFIEFCVELKSSSEEGATLETDGEASLSQQQGGGKNGRGGRRGRLRRQSSVVCSRVHSLNTISYVDTGKFSGFYWPRLHAAPFYSPHNDSNVVPSGSRTYLPLSLLDLQCGRLYVIRICCVGKSIINKIT